MALRGPTEPALVLCCSQEWFQTLAKERGNEKIPVEKTNLGHFSNLVQEVYMFKRFRKMLLKWDAPEFKLLRKEWHGLTDKSRGLRRVI